MVQRRNLYMSASMNKAVVGRYKTTRDRNFPLTYEMAQKPNLIAHTKAWNAWNTSKLLQFTIKVLYFL